MKKAILVILLGLALFLPIGYAAGPKFYIGYSFLNGSLAPNGTIIEVFVNNQATSSSNVTVGEGILANTREGWYIISFEADTGSNLTFKINGAPMVSANGCDNSTQAIASGQLIVLNFNLSANKSADGAACTYNSGCSGGYCLHSVCRASSPYCGDGYCDSGESCSSDNSACSTGYACTSGCVLTTTTTSGGSVSAPTSSISSNLHILVGETGAFLFDKTDVELIEILASQEIGSGAITVREVGKPSSSQDLSDSKAYKYLDIRPTFSNNQISQGTITFKVPSSWLTSNNVAPGTIKLHKLVNGIWAPLPTKILNYDGVDYRFETETTSFSTYAIFSVPETPEETPSEVVTSPAEEIPLRPLLTVISPTSMQMFDDTVTVEVSSSNIQIVEAGGTATETQGHYYAFVDSQQGIHFTDNVVYFNHLEPGYHTLTVEIRKNDNSQFSPPIRVSMQFQISSKAAAVQQPQETSRFYSIVLIAVIIIIAFGALIFYKKSRE